MAGFALGWLGSAAVIMEISRGNYVSAAVDLVMLVVGTVGILRLRREAE